MQYELEQAHHANCERRAAQHRLIAEAEQLVAHDTPLAPFLGAVAERLRWPVNRAQLAWLAATPESWLSR
jgi:hypothetical protein